MTTSSLRAKNVSLALTANDLARSIQFYVEGLGLPISKREEHDGKLLGVLLAIGDVELGISQDDFSKGRDRVKGVGMSLYFETEQDLDAIASRLKAAGITLLSEPAALPWGPKGFRVADPDGFKITIAEPS